MYLFECLSRTLLKIAQLVETSGKQTSLKRQPNRNTEQHYLNLHAVTSLGPYRLNSNQKGSKITVFKAPKSAKFGALKTVIYNMFVAGI